MKTLVRKVEQNQKQLDLLQKYNQQISNIGKLQEGEDLEQKSPNSKRHHQIQSYADRQQHVSILQLQKPIIEFDIQISREYSDKMVIFEDSIPEELVEEFIVYNRMRPQSFNPILVLVLDKMKEIENTKDVCFVNLRDEKYYQVLMKKQQQLCQEYQNAKDMIKKEKIKGEELIDLKLSRVTYKSDDIVIQSPPSNVFEDQKNNNQNSKLKDSRKMNQHQPYAEVSQFTSNPTQYTNDTDYQPEYHDQEIQNEPLQIYYDHLNPVNQPSSLTHNIFNQANNGQKQRMQTPKNQRQKEMPKKAQRSTPSPSPPPSNLSNKTNHPQKLKFVRNGKSQKSNSPLNTRSPLKYPNEQSYLDKNEQKKKYYNHQGEQIDPLEVSERLHKMRTEPPCSRYEPKEDSFDKKCTFKPQINENSRVLSKLYHQKQNANRQNPKNQAEQENEEGLSQPHHSKVQGKSKPRNRFGDGEDCNQSADTTIYQVVDPDQLKSSVKSQSQKNNQDDFPNQDQYNPPQPLYSSPQYQPQYQDIQQNNFNSPSQISQQQNPLAPYNYLPQQQPFPVYEKQINIREEIIYQHPSEKAYQPQRISKLKQMVDHSNQTSQIIQQSIEEPQQNNPVPFDPNLNQNYFKYLEMRDQIDEEQQNKPPLLQSFSKPSQPLKRSMGLQTSEQINQSKFNKSTSIKNSEMESEKKLIDFDPNLNNNYFKYLEMRDEMEKEDYAPQEQQYQQQFQQNLSPPILQSFSQQTSQQFQPLKKSFGIQTSEFNKSSSIKTSVQQSERQPIEFNPHLNQNYFKYLQVQEEMEKERGELPQFAPQHSSVLQSKAHILSNPPPKVIDQRNISIQTSDYLLYLKSQHEKNHNDTASDKENYVDETPKQFVPFDPHLNQNYFKYLQMEEDKQKDEDPLHQYLVSNQQSLRSQSYDDKNSQSQSSYNHINRNKYDERTPKQTQQQPSAYLEPDNNQNFNRSRGISDQKITSSQLNSAQQDQQEEQIPIQKEFPRENSSPLKRSSRSYHEYSPIQEKLKKNGSIQSIQDNNNKSQHDNDKSEQDNGSVIYCDEDPIILQSDDPFVTYSQVIQQQVPPNKIQDQRTNFHSNNFNKPKDYHINQKPDIVISSVRSVSPRIDKQLQNIQQSKLATNNNPSFQNSFKPNELNNNKNNNIKTSQLLNKSIPITQSHSHLFQSKNRGQITEIEQEALEEVFRQIKTQQKGLILRKGDIDLYNLPFEVVLRSHIEILLKNIKENEDITLQSFFQASENSMNLNLFLNECVDFLNKNKNNIS